MAFAPVGILLLVLVPLLVYWIYPPEVKEGAEVPTWAAQELEKMGPLTQREITLGILVVIALLLWIFGGNIMEATTAAIVVISLDADPNVVTWEDITANKAAWNTLAWFATLVALADGLTRVGFVKWFAESVAGQLTGADAHRGGRGSAADQFFRSLFVCQRYGARHRDDSGAARGGVNDSRSQHANPRARSVPATRYYGHHHAVRNRTEPGILRQRVSAGRGLLAAGRDFRRDLFRRIPRDRRALDVVHTVSGARVLARNPQREI